MIVRLSFGISTPRIRGIRPISVGSQSVGRAGPGRRSRGGLGRRPGNLKERKGIRWKVKRVSASTLPLLVAGVGADHVHLAVATHDLAMLADTLDAGSDLHRRTTRFLKPIH